MYIKDKRYADSIWPPGSVRTKGQSWSWSYVSWIYNYLCKQCLSPLSHAGDMYSIQHYV